MDPTRRKPVNNPLPGGAIFGLFRHSAALGLLVGLSLTGLSPASAPAEAPRSFEKTESEKPASSAESESSQLDALRKKVKELERHNQQLVRSLTVADAEADFFRKEYQKLRLRNEALGVDVLTGDEKALRERLVRAVGEGYQREMQRREAVSLMGNLLATSRRILAKAEGIDAERRSAFEVAARRAEGFLTGKTAGNILLGSSLQDGQVVSVLEDRPVVILNIGRLQGVQHGMPFSVLRKGKIVGKITVYTVDDQFSTGLIESRESLGKEDEDILVGDQVRVWTQR